jgi:hypothetical protein
MTKPKGKTPSLLSLSNGTPTTHTCGKATPCDRCQSTVLKGKTCFRVPKMASGFTNYPIFCVDCLADIVERTKADLSVLEETVRQVQSG